MKIRKFDLQNDDIKVVSDMIIKAYSDSGQPIYFDENTNKSIRDLIEIGNNFVGHENIHVSIIENSLAALFIGYTGKSYSKIKTLLELLIKFKLTQAISYLLVGAQVFDTLYTPNLNEDDYYISVIVVDPTFRNQGIATCMLQEAIRIAKQIDCKRIVLDVNQDNTIAKSLYNKFGFQEISRKKSENLDNEYYSMEYILS